MVYIVRFFLFKMQFFPHNSNVFGSCVIHILYTGCAKIKKKIRRQKVNHLTAKSEAALPRNLYGYYRDIDYR
jgi:hypothetical protein